MVGQFKGTLLTKCVTRSPTSFYVLTFKWRIP